MQESGFAAARWVSSWIFHLGEVKGGRSPFWIKGQDFCGNPFGGITWALQTCEESPALCGHQDGHKQRDWDVAGVPHPAGVWGSIPLYQDTLSPPFPLPQGTRMHKCMPGVTQLPKAQNVRFSQVSRTCRCFKSKCYLNKNNWVFERIFWSVPFEWEKLSFL